jgi:3-dehydrotetronate 4-kinase
MLLGCIADDFTGATDLANTLVRGGMRTLQTIGVPRLPLPPSYDAVVVALKSRTIPADDAIAQSLAAHAWLHESGCRQFYFKYCSTFDSTPAGNIGPVAEALMDELGAPFAIACPAFPANARTVYMGQLFVGDVPLAESGMRHHPLTPMTDSNLVRVLQAQSRGSVGLVPWRDVAQGPTAIRARFEALRPQDVRLAIVDAITDADLVSIGEACADHRLVTGASGAAIGLTANFRRAGLLDASTDATRLPACPGRAAIVSGSCSSATNAQVRHWIDSGGAAVHVDPLEADRDAGLPARLVDEAKTLLASSPVLFHATASPERVKHVQATLGTERASRVVEETLAHIATRAVDDAGVTRLVVAGGETSGAVVQALGISALRIGPQIAPGVPWTFTEGTHSILLALKSGNFGSVDFFARSLAMLAST